MQTGANANHLLARCRPVGGAGRNGPKIGHKKTRPSTQYTVNDLASPGYEIGSRHPVNCRMPGILTGMCEPVHKRAEKVPATRAVTMENIPSPTAWCRGPIGPAPKIPAKISAKIPAMMVLVTRLDRQGADQRQISAGRALARRARLHRQAPFMPVSRALWRGCGSPRKPSKSKMSILS